MTKFKMMPLVAMISAGLIGCGSSSDGGSGSAPTPAPKPKAYSLQLVHMLVDQDPANISSACQSPTYFKQYSSGNVDYAQIASSVHSIGSYNKDGSFNKALSLSSNGVVTFTENDVEDGGYITIIDNVGSSSSPIFQSLSIQKTLLGNYLVNIESQQGNQSSCYQGGKLAFDTTQRIMNLSSGSDLGSPTDSGFETYRDGEVLTPYGQTEKRPINLVSSNEFVLGKAYRNGELKGYVLSRGSELSVDGSSSINSQRLTALTDSAQVSWPSSPSYTLNSVELEALAQNERYKWQTLTTGTASVLVSDTFSYVLYLKGSMSGWNFSSVQPQQSNTMDVSLTESTIASGIEPNVMCSASGCVVDNNGVVSTNLNRIQRAYIEVSSQSKHTIYGEPNAQDELVIPDYQIGSAHKPQGSEVLEASYINYRESLGADFFALVMNKFNAPESTASYVDKVSILKTPQEIRALEAQEAKFYFETIQK